MKRKLGRVRIKPKHIKVHNRKMIISRDKNKKKKNTISEKTSKDKVNIINSLPNITSKGAFIIGGGPSAESIDFNKLKLEGYDIICINKAIEHVDKAKFFITMDYTFFNKSTLTVDQINKRVDKSFFMLNKEGNTIKNINGTFVDTKFNIKYEKINKIDNVIVSNKKTNPGFGNNILNFAHGSNSGYCAIQLAILLGYEEINLIGFDMCAVKNNTHFHHGYKQDGILFNKKLQSYKEILFSDLKRYDKNNIFTLSNSISLSEIIKHKTLEDIINNNKRLVNNQNKNNDLIIVAYYTINTPYEKEAEKLINSIKKLGLDYDVVGVKNLGDWQSNTRFKASFMKKMLDKHKNKNLLYVDSDAIIHSAPTLFNDYDCDIAVRWQDFRWRKNECLSGTIFMANNKKTRKLCKKWNDINNSEGDNPKTFEQWNLGSVIKEMRDKNEINDKNLPPEYTFIFDSMKKMYPNVTPIIEHFQASRKYRGKV